MKRSLREMKIQSTMWIVVAVLLLSIAVLDGSAYGQVLDRDRVKQEIEKQKEISECSSRFLTARNKQHELVFRLQISVR